MPIFCTIYYILSYIETIPQIIKLIKTNVDFLILKYYKK